MVFTLPIPLVMMQLQTLVVEVVVLQDHLNMVVVLVEMEDLVSLF